MPRLTGHLFIRCACWFFMTLAGLSAPSFASDAPKAPPKEKEPTYANEEGATGRSGNVYKRILKDPRGAPEPLTKEEPKPTETKKEDKEEKAKAGDPAPRKKKNTMTAMAPLPKKRKRKTPKKTTVTVGAIKQLKKRPLHLVIYSTQRLSNLM